MNNNMPNNNNGNNSLNAVSLGSIDNGNVNNIPPVPPVDSLNQQPVDAPANNQVVNPVPSVDSVTPVNPVPPVDNVSPVQPVEAVQPVDNIPVMEPVAPVSYDVPETINNFNTTPVFNEIGTVPPITDGPVQAPVVNTPEPKPKKKMNKLIFVMIIVLLIAAVGVGVYIFLNMSNEPAQVSVVPTAVEIEAGSEVSTDINDYATFTGINSSNCSLDTASITDTSVVGAEYAFSITCGAAVYNGTATIVDTVAPVVVLKEVTVQVGGSISPEDFIDNCSDASECSYTFEDESTVNGYLSTAGNYHVNIVVTDSSGNEVVAEGTLVVTEDEVPDLYLSCTMDNETVRLGITDSTFTGAAVRSYIFTFDDINTYNTFKSANENSSEVTYENVTGTPTFDDANLTLTLTQNLTQAQISSLPTAYGDLRTYYDNLGYSCTLEQP